jgi:SAM-dependent methyltransferase
MGRIIDLTGQTFGSLIVTGRDFSPTVGEARWLCDCMACRKTGHSVKGTLLRDGRAKSCGCQIGGILDLTGQRFGRWVVLERSNAPLTRDGKEQTTRSAWWWCRCYCGIERAVSAQALRKGMSTSCGCYQKEHTSEVQLGHNPYESDLVKRVESAKLAHTEIRRYGSNSPRPKSKFQDTLYDKDWLESRYLGQNLSKREIAERASSSVFAVSSALKRFGLKRQDLDPSDKVSKHKRPRLTGDDITTQVMYARARRHKPSSSCVVCGGVGKHINHKDRRPWNNDLSNLERVCPICHSRQHAFELEVLIEWLHDRFSTPFLDVHLEARNRLLQHLHQDTEKVSILVQSLTRRGFPIVCLAEDSVRASFLKLCGVTCCLDGDSILGPYISTGTNVCSSFFPNRYRAKYLGSLSAWEAWHDEGYLRKAVELQLSSGDPVTPERVLKALIFQHRTPSVFRPAVAKYIYEKYAKGGVVWDPCAGYGGRLMGAMAGGVTKYIGTDIEPETVEGNRRLAEALGLSDRCEVYCARAERFIPNELLDLVFTSPPYFNLETYGPNTTVALLEQGSVNGWLESFLEPLMLRAFQHLKPGGYLILNLPSRPVHNVRLDESAGGLALKIGFLACSSIFMPIRRRGQDWSTYKTEPVLVWTKGVL